MSALKKETETINALNALQDNSIIEWLDEIKRTKPIDNKVRNPLLDKNGREKDPISITSKGVIYPIIIKWCIEEYKNGYDFTNIPNYQAILSSLTAVTAATAATAATGAKAKSPAATAIDFTLIAKKWKDTPTTDPFTGNTIAVSINPTSEYVAIYSKIIDGLTKHLLKISSKKVLSVEDCKYIKESMPDEHAIYNTGTDTIFYDHLLFKNFLNKHAYDEDYLKEIQPYVYSHIYDKIEATLTSYGYNDYNNVSELLVNFCPLSFDPANPTYTFTIGYMIERMCKDIKNVLYMHESKITSEQINKAIFNKAVIKYFISIVKLHLNFGLITNESLRIEIRSHFNNNKLTKYNVDSKKDFHFVDYIYNQFVEHFFPRNPYNPTQYDLTKDVNVCDTLLPVYDCILKLYSDNNIKKNRYRYIKDPTINKPQEPQYPIKRQLPQDLQRYKILSSRPSSVKDASKERQIKEMEEENARIFDEKLKVYEKEKKVYEKKIEIYEKNKGVKNGINIFDYRISSKHNKGQWDGEALQMNKPRNRSAGVVKVPKALYANPYANVKAYRSASPNKYNRNSSGAPRVSFVRYDKKNKTFILKKEAKIAKHNGSVIVYNNTEDPNTQEDFDNMDEKKQKYTSDIVFNDANNNTFHYRFETITMYNYVLNCIENCKEPKNILVDLELTDENLDEICRKIKFFTNKPTLNSHREVRALLDNCKHDNLLAFSYEVVNLPVFTTKPIIGRVNIFLVINLGGILFRVINKIVPNGAVPYNYPNQKDEDNSVVLVLPYLTEETLNGVNGVGGLEETYHPVSILTELQQKLPKGDMLGVKYFPYRKNNNDGERWKEIVKLPQFDLNFSDTKDVVFKKLTDYKNNKIAVL
jgi:hypothetical protein